MELSYEDIFHYEISKATAAYFEAIVEGGVSGVARQVSDMQAAKEQMERKSAELEAFMEHQADEVKATLEENDGQLKGIIEAQNVHAHLCDVMIRCVDDMLQLHQALIQQRERVGSSNHQLLLAEGTLKAALRKLDCFPDPRSDERWNALEKLAVAVRERDYQASQVRQQLEKEAQLVDTLVGQQGQRLMEDKKIVTDLKDCLESKGCFPTRRTIQDPPKGAPGNDIPPAIGSIASARR